MSEAGTVIPHRSDGFADGHGNYPRLGWILLGGIWGAGETVVGSIWVTIGTGIVYSVIFVLWTMYLLGRRNARS